MSGRYDNLKRKGIVYVDIANNTIQRDMLEHLIKQSRTRFSIFFDEFVVRRAKSILLVELLGGICHGDDRMYRRCYGALVTGTDDRRTRNAVMREFDVLSYCSLHGVPYVPYMGMAQRKREVRSRKNQPIRVFMHVQDKMDLRAVAALFGVPLWKIVGELVAEGMLHLFVRHCTTDQERSLIHGRVQDVVPDDVCASALDTLYERIIYEYHSAIKSVYGIMPELRSDFDHVALQSIRHGRSIDLHGIDLDKMSSTTGLSVGCIAVPVIHEQPSIIESINGTNNYHIDLDSDEVSSIKDDNIERILGKPLGLSDNIADPVISDTLSAFRDILFSKDATRRTKMSDIWRQYRIVTRAEVESLAILNGVDLSGLDADALDLVVDDICKTAFAVLVKHGLMSADTEDMLDPDDELVLRIRCTIDDCTEDGGITRSQLRNAIGRNHTRYIAAIDEILAYLVETGRYAYENQRYIATSGNNHGTRMVRTPVIGRPRHSADEQIERHIEGRMDDYFPRPPPKEDKDDDDDE